MAGITATSRRLVGRYVFELATQNDDAELRKLLRQNPMDGAIQITFEREPNFFAAAGLMGTVHQTVVARSRESGDIVGMGTRSVRPMYLDGTVRSAGYLGELRVDQAYQGRFNLIRNGYAVGRALHSRCAVTHYLTSIVTENARARRLLEAGLSSMPTYTFLCHYHTLIIPARQWFRSRPASCPVATEDYREQLADCLHRNYRRYAWTPYWTTDELGSPERTPGLAIGDFLVTIEGSWLNGCMALWDQRAFRQIVVRGYGSRLRRWRPFLNFFAPITGLPRLPTVGEPWAYAYVSPLAIDNDDPDVFIRLLQATIRRAGQLGYDYVLLGLAESHPLLATAQRAVRHRRFASSLYLVTWDELPFNFERVKNAIPHPEISLL